MGGLVIASLLLQILCTCVLHDISRWYNRPDIHVQIAFVCALLQIFFNSIQKCLVKSVIQSRKKNLRGNHWKHLSTLSEINRKENWRIKIELRKKALFYCLRKTFFTPISMININYVFDTGQFECSFLAVSISLWEKTEKNRSIFTLTTHERRGKKWT